MSTPRLPCLPNEVQAHCFAFLDGPSVLTLETVCRRLNYICSTNGAVWQALVQSLWEGKVEICPTAITHRERREYREAYWISLHDSHRIAITEDEMCRMWYLRGFVSAGPPLSSLKCHMYFDPMDYTVTRIDSSVWDGAGMKWKFTPFPDRPENSVVRLTVPLLGQQLPRMFVRRHSRNWGWIMESIWVQYTSFDPDESDPQVQAVSRIAVEIGTVDATLFKLHAHTPDDLVEAQTLFHTLIANQLSTMTDIPPDSQIAIDISLPVQWHNEIVESYV